MKERFSKVIAHSSSYCRYSISEVQYVEWGRDMWPSNGH